MSTLNRALVLFGNKGEDSGDNPFIWGTVITKTPQDALGNPVSNPGSIMVYNAKGIKPGQVEDVLIMSRGIAGLYNLIPADKTEEVLSKMGERWESIPEVPLIESQTSGGVSREEARSHARAVRRRRRGLEPKNSSTDREEVVPQ